MDGAAIERVRVLAAARAAGVLRDRRALGRRQVDARRRSRCARAPVVSLEDLYGGWDGLEAGHRPPGATRCSSRCAAGRTALVPRYDWHAQALGGAVAARARRALLVVEGVGAGALAAAPYLSVLVWLERRSESERRARSARARRRDLRRRALGAVGARRRTSTWRATGRSEPRPTSRCEAARSSTARCRGGA